MGLEVSLPPIREQRRIVDLVGALDTQIDALGSEANAAGCLRTALRERLLSGDESWSHSTWGALVTRTTGISYASGDLSASGTGLPFINLKSIGRGGGYRPEGLKWYSRSIKKSQLVRPGDLLIANTDLTRDKAILGCPVLVPNLPEPYAEACISLDVSKVEPVANQVTPAYLYEVLQLRSCREFMKTHSSGTTVIHLKTKDVTGLLIRHPDLDEQKRITEVLSRAESLSSLLRTESSRLRDVRERLLALLLSGQIEIQGSYDAVLAEAV